MKIAGVGHYAPPRIVSNQDLEAWLETTDDWITTRTGMKRRHWVSEEEGTSDLASAAASAALVHAGLQAHEIDCFIVATVTPDYYFPATACLVAARLGVSEKPAFDIGIACSGFIYGLTVASGLIRSGVYRRIMLIGAETLSKILDKEDRSTAILFGDGAGAVIIEQNAEDSFLGSSLGADGSRPDCSTRMAAELAGRSITRRSTRRSISSICRGAKHSSWRCNGWSKRPTPFCKRRD